jgi:DNA mismatch repair protein MutS2
VLELRQARHPLLEQALTREGRTIVPLDLELSRKNHILVISGPNAGGKSVCLKTVGLLQWMFQCGMPVPALENSQMPIFDDLFIDIGDEQSIDNDLSTYSSHLLNMKRMLREASRDSLVLIDEFGTGTEPVMGGAIAQAILQRLAQRGSYGVITTHYSNLKSLAGVVPGIVNGAMMFDVANIQPLFRLEMGVPGSSFAIEIARKIGLPDEIIRTASELAGSDHVNLERQLREIARDRRYWEQKRDRIRLADRRIEEKEARLDTSLAGAKEQRNESIRTAKAEAARITADANRMVESTIKTIRESQADKELTRLARHELDEFRTAVEEKPKPPKTAGPPPLQAGSKVRIVGQDTVGEVQSLRSGKATVAFGQMSTTVPVERLEVVSNAEYRKQSRTPQMKISADISARKLNFRTSIDVRGQRVDEALDTVRDFIDSALMLGVGEVTILHGKGTGALKEEIRRYLRAIPAVASAADEHPDRGGAGITIVKFG